MEEFFYGALGLLACATPVAALVAFGIYIFRKPAKDPRVDELELEVLRLRGDLQLLAARVSRGVAAAELAPPAAQSAITAALARVAPRVEESVAAGSAAAAASETATAAATASEMAAATAMAAPTASETAPAFDTTTAPAFDTTTAPASALPSPSTELAADAPIAAPAKQVRATQSAADDWPSVVAEPSPGASASATPAASSAASSAAPPASPPPGAPPPSPAGVPPRGPFTPPPAAIEGGLERWIGVRGAAALGALILVLAGFYFFQYSIAHNLIGPVMRVVLGTLVGIAAIGLSEWPLRKRSPVLSNALAGAGIAILYITFWAAHGVFHLVHVSVAGGLFVLVTATCAMLAIRRDAISIAALGLLGGFATPIALSTGQDRPIPLFTYLLLLDIALLALARKKRWPSLAVGSLVATALYQLMWLFGRMDAERSWLGVAIVVVFGALFALFPVAAKQDGDKSREAKTATVVHIGAVLLPFLLALSFAGRASLGEQLWETAVLVVVLSIGAAFVGRRESAEWIGLGAVGGALGILALWALQHRLTLNTTWQLVGTLALVAAAHHVTVELGRGKALSTWLAAGAASLGGIALLALISTGLRTTEGATPLLRLLPYLVAFAVLAALSLRQASFEGRAVQHLALGLVLPIALAILDVTSSLVGGFPDGLATGFAVAASVALTAVAVVRRAPEARPYADHGAALAAVIALLAITPHSSSFAAWTYLAACALLATLTLLAAARRASGLAAIAGLVAAAIALGVRIGVVSRLAPLTLDLAVMAGLVLLFALWPLAAGPRYRARASGWRAAALPGLVLFLPMRVAWIRAFGDGYLGALAIGLAAVALGAALIARKYGPEDRSERRSSIVWLAAATATFVTLAIPLQLDNEWLTIGWALEAVALLALDRRLDHAGLKWLAMGLFAAVATRLLVNPYVLGYYTRGDLRIVNWIAYTYLVPSVCLLAGWWLLRTDELARRRVWERSLLPERAVLAPALAAAAFVAVFAWLNLTIIDWYASGPRLSIPMERMPARDLTMSIVWALYAIALLGVGLWRSTTGLRFASLGLLLVTCGKVFLYDLGHLRDLYRVAALVGLAFSLLFVSLVYSRLLFRRAAAESEGTP